MLKNMIVDKWEKRPESATC